MVRSYNRATRLAQQAELKARVAQAAAQLHKAQGVLATSHADVAREARVSVPTVYKHFPTVDELVQACSAHVAAQAPAFPAERILQAPDLAAAARALVKAMDVQHAYFSPWVVWREDHRVAALGALAARQRSELLGLCEAVLARHGGGGEHRHAAAWWQSLLGFELRDSLSRAHGISRAAYRRGLVRLLLAVAGPQPANVRASGPSQRV